jgi:hypothetical protein
MVTSQNDHIQPSIWKRHLWSFIFSWKFWTTSWWNNPSTLWITVIFLGRRYPW